jgi:hypothetical protein
MNHAEGAAKRALEGVLPCTMVYQPEQSHGECDFELRYHGGATVAVEVTSSVDQAQAETMAAIRGKKNGSSRVPATECKKSWVIFPAKNARINKIRQLADEYLSRVEQAGMDKFFCVRDWQHQCVHSICNDLGVTSGQVTLTGASPTIRIASPIGGGAVGGSDAIEAGKKEAWKQDNRKKLAATRVAEHDFVVYIDVTNGLPWVALTDFEPPSVLPNLPREITHMWLVGEKVNAFVVWHASTKEPWSS